MYIYMDTLPIILSCSSLCACGVINHGDEKQYNGILFHLFFISEFTHHNALANNLDMN